MGSSHYPVCSKPAITLSRKDWHSSANRAVLRPFRARRALGNPAPPAAWPRWGCGGGGNDAAPTKWRIPMARLTDTQLVILSTASRRNDRGVDLPANVTGEALRKAVDKLIRTGLLEEVRANGSLLAWRRDVEAGPMALRITKRGLEAIGVKDTAVTCELTPVSIPFGRKAALRGFPRARRAP